MTISLDPVKCFDNSSLSPMLASRLFVQLQYVIAMLANGIPLAVLKRFRKMRHESKAIQVLE